MERPRLLLVPALCELEWRIKPQLEEWAEVATYDPPGVGSEPTVDATLTDGVAERGLAELERRGWESCVVVADEFGTAAAAKLAADHPEKVRGLALGHPCLAYDDAAVNRDMRDALVQLGEGDYRTFARHLTQTTKGAYDDALVEQFIERVPQRLAMDIRDEPEIGDWIHRAGVPLLFAEHSDCLLFTREGFQAAVEAFPGTPTLSTAQKPSASAEFAEALRSFCARLGG